MVSRLFFCSRGKRVLHRIDHVWIRLIGFRTEWILIRISRLRIERRQFWFRF
jgi:hypothetical protein